MDKVKQAWSVPTMSEVDIQMTAVQNKIGIGVDQFTTDFGLCGEIINRS